MYNIKNAPIIQLLSDKLTRQQCVCTGVSTVNALHNSPDLFQFNPMYRYQWHAVNHMFQLLL